MLDSRTLPNAKREHLQKEVDLRIAARKALLKRLWVIPRTGTTVPNQLWSSAARRLALWPFASKGESCTQNKVTPIDNLSEMNWSCCAASASLAAAPRGACRFCDAPGFLACQLAAIW
jgi:hypothetical protein